MHPEVRARVAQHGGYQQTGRTGGKLQQNINEFHKDLLRAHQNPPSELWLKCAGIAVAAEVTLNEGRRAKAGRLLAEAKQLWFAR